MAWCGIEGHDAVVDRFERCVARNRLASSYLFIGPPGIGKRSFAIHLAQAFLCERHAEAELMPCLQCPSCQQVVAGSHPDVDLIARPAGKTVIPVELFIGDLEHRSREGLCHRISLRPSSGRRRIAIIDDADWMNQEGANCLLKTLEEPPPKSLIILITTSLQRQLMTVRSRCQVVRFQPLSNAFVRQYVLEQGLCDDEGSAHQLADLAEGSLDRAREFADPALRQFGDELAARWDQPVPGTIGIAKDLQSFVESAGRDAASRRNRLRQVIQLTMQRLRHELLELTVVGSPTLAPSSATGEDTDGPLDVADERLDRCLLALQQIDAHANLATLVECWVDDLAQAFFLRR